MEHINIQCDAETKGLIRKQVAASSNPSLLFSFNSPIVRSKSNAHLTSIEMIIDEIYKQLATPHAERKMSMVQMGDIE